MFLNLFKLKYLAISVLAFTMFSCEESETAPGNAQNPPVYQKSDLEKLRWIEGTWKTDVSGPGYYQTFHFPSDSILEVVSYQFDGKDTSNTTISTLYWKNNHFYMGPNGEWVAVHLNKNSIQLDPIRADWHTIHWSYDNEKNEWTAVQKKPDFIRTIKMKKQAALEDMLKK